MQLTKIVLNNKEVCSHLQRDTFAFELPYKWLKNY